MGFDANGLRHPRRGLEPERVDELLSHQADRGRTEDDNALFVQTNDALIGAALEQLGEVEFVAL